MYPHAPIPHEGVFGTSEIRCILVHDHVLLRQGIRRILRDEPDIQVITEAETAAEALTRIIDHRPDVVIADARAFGCTVGQAKRLIQQASPETGVLFLTTQEGDDPLREAGGSASYVARQTSAEELVEMVRRAYGAARALPLHRGRAEWPSEELLARKRVLTGREREVLKLLAEGRTVRSTAAVLGLSVKTVDAHKFNLMRKLGIHNKAELVMWAIQKRVVKLPANF